MSQPHVRPPDPERCEVPASANELAAELRERGERLTRPRMALLRALIDLADAHPTAEALLEGARRFDPDLGESSLYRGLEWLEATGVAQHTHFGHGAATWHLAVDDRQHLTCDLCGGVEHIPPSVFDAAFRAVAERYGFTPLPRHFSIAGLCRACSGGGGGGGGDSGSSPL